MDGMLLDSSLAFAYDEEVSSSAAGRRGEEEEELIKRWRVRQDLNL
jgi:hypothetical protein